MHKGRKKSRRFKRSHGGNITERKKKVEFEQTKTNKKKKKETFKSIPKHQSVQPISDNRPCIKTPACKKINKQKKNL